MLTANLDLSRQLSNGSRGVIDGFSEKKWPLVKFIATNEIVEVTQFTIHISKLF